MDESNLEFYNNIFLYLIPIIQFFILIIPFLGSDALYDQRKNFFSRLSTRGYSLLFLALFLIIVSIRQAQVTNELNQLSVAKTEKKMAKRDSINQSKNALDRFKTTEMLAQYGLKVDTQSNEIVKILKDPNTRKTTNIYGEDPVFEISEARIDKENGRRLYLKFTSFESTSYDINVKLDILGEVYDTTFFLDKNITPIAENTTIVKNYSLGHTFIMDHFNILSINRFYFKLFGTYKKSDGSTKHIEKYYALDKNSPNGLGYPTAEMLKIIKNVYKKTATKK